MDSRPRKERIMEMTPLEEIQHEAREKFGWNLNRDQLSELDGFLVRAFDAGVKAVNELNEELRTQ